jgi:hypothetical protein
VLDERPSLKWLGLLALAAAALFTLYPSFDWYRRDAGDRARQESARERPAACSTWASTFAAAAHLVMEVETDQLPPDMPVAEAVNQAIEVIRHRVDQLGIAEPYIARQGDARSSCSCRASPTRRRRRSWSARRRSSSFGSSTIAGGAGSPAVDPRAGQAVRGRQGDGAREGAAAAGHGAAADRDGSAYVVGARRR